MNDLGSSWYINSDADSVEVFKITEDMIVIETTSTEINQTLRINKYFANAYTVDWGDGSEIEVITADTTHTYTTA